MQRWPTRITIPRQSRFLACTQAHVVTHNRTELDVVVAAPRIYIRMVPELVLHATWPLSSLALAAIAYWPRTGHVALDAATLAPAMPMSMVPFVENQIAAALSNTTNARTGDHQADADVIAAAIAALFKAPLRMRTTLLRLASSLPQQLTQFPNLAPAHPRDLAIM